MRPDELNLYEKRAIVHHGVRIHGGRHERGVVLFRKTSPADRLASARILQRRRERETPMGPEQWLAELRWRLMAADERRWLALARQIGAATYFMQAPGFVMREPGP